MKSLAIIADGNRRWEKRNALPDGSGHAQGLTVIERCCEWAMERELGSLTFYCFSTENWGRAKREVDRILELARWYCRERREWYIARGIRVRFAGRRDRFPRDIIEAFAALERDTAAGNGLSLYICADYGGRNAIARAVEAGARTEEELDRALAEELPVPDAILRTGGEVRLSNFLLWQAAYTELFFVPTLFPELEAGDLDRIAEAFEARQRHFGG